jgi:hypothetical protein
MDHHRPSALPTPGELWVNLMLGSLGMGYVIYGRKMGHSLALGCGVLLMVFPYFIAGVWPQLAIGSLLALLPWLLR